MRGSASNPPRDRGVNIRKRPASYNASKTGRERRRSRSASSLCSRMIGAISRAASMSDESVSQCMAILLCSAPVRRSDVLVDVKEVVRVVGRLRCCEPRVVGAIVRRRSVVVVAGHEVDVTAFAARVGMNGCVVVLHPPDVGLVIGRVRPDSHDHRGKALVPVSEGGLVGADPLSRAVDRMEMHGRTQRAVSSCRARHGQRSPRR